MVLCRLQTDSFTSSFPIPVSLLASPDCSGWDFQHVVNRSGASGHPRLVPGLRGKALSFSPGDDLSCGLVTNGLLLCVARSLYTHRVERFYHVDVDVCNTLLLRPPRWTCFLTFVLVMWFVTPIHVQVEKHPRSPGEHPTCCRVQSAEVLLRISAPTFTRVMSACHFLSL